MRTFSEYAKGVTLQRELGNRLPDLGIIEGFFGRPWSWKDRSDVVTMLGRAGYSFYHYAPKIDQFLRRNWTSRHPKTEEDALRIFRAVFLKKESSVFPNQV